MRHLALLVVLSGCMSHKPYAPDSVTVHSGYAWHNEIASEWQGPSLGVSVGWAFGQRAAAYREAQRQTEILQDQRRLLGEIAERQEAELEAAGVADPVPEAGGVLDDAARQITDTSAGPLGLPRNLWFAVASLVFIVGLVIAHRAGLRVPFLTRNGHAQPGEKRP